MSIETATELETEEDVDLDEGRLARDARDLEPLLRAQCYRLLDNFFSA